MFCVPRVRHLQVEFYFRTGRARGLASKAPQCVRAGSQEEVLPIATMRELLEAGVHYGHHTSRWNPKMGSYIYKNRHSIHIVDLRQTVRGLVRACRFLTTIAEQGAEMILVGTKRQARATIAEQGKRAGIHYVAERWLGGTLTNFSIVMGRLKRLEELEQQQESGDIESKGKKRASVLRRELAKLQKNLGGIRHMARLPDALIIIDPRREKNALREAQALDIPTIAFLDTDASPDMIDIVIPGNDDAMRSIQLICTKLMDAILEGRASAPLPPEGEEQVEPPAAEAPAPSAETPAPAKPTAPPAPPAPAAPAAPADSAATGQGQPTPAAEAPAPEPESVESSAEQPPPPDAPGQAKPQAEPGG